MGWLRRIRGRSTREKIRNEVTRIELEIEEKLVEKIRRRRLKWCGHVERMNKERLDLPLLALHGHIEGNRSRGRKRKTWLDNIREDLKEKDTELTTIGEIVKNRTMWRNFIMASSSGNLWKRRKKKIPRFGHVSEYMHDILHWLPPQQRVFFRISSLA